MIKCKHCGMDFYGVGARKFYNKHENDHGLFVNKPVDKGINI